jgi:hypothetical protein
MVLSPVGVPIVFGREPVRRRHIRSPRRTGLKPPTSHSGAWQNGPTSSAPPEFEKPGTTPSPRPPDSPSRRQDPHQRHRPIGPVHLPRACGNSRQPVDTTSSEASKALRSDPPTACWATRTSRCAPRRQRTWHGLESSPPHAVVAAGRPSRSSTQGGRSPAASSRRRLVGRAGSPAGRPCPLTPSPPWCRRTRCPSTDAPLPAAPSYPTITAIVTVGSHLTPSFPCDLIAALDPSATPGSARPNAVGSL